MLVLSRKKQEQLVIRVGGEMLVIRVVEMDSNRVRLGIIAPDSVTVYREEIARRMEDWQRELDELLCDTILDKPAQR